MANKLYNKNGDLVNFVKAKKPFYKRWWFIALVVLLLIGLFSGGDEEESAKVSEPETEEVEVVEETEAEELELEPEEEIEEVTENVEETTQEVEEKEEELEVADLTEEEEQEFQNSLSVLLAENMAIEQFEGVAEVHYSEEENAMVFLPIDENFTMALAMVESGLLDKSEWNLLRDNFVEYSGILSDFTDDESLLVYVVNPANEDNYILMANNGQIIYDVFNE